MVFTGIQQIMERTRLLSAAPAFARVPRESLMGLAKIAREDRFDTGKTVFQEGEVGTRLFLIVSGRAEVSCKTANGTAVLAQISRGALFGEVAVAVPNTPRTATVTATAPLVVISLSSDDLDRLCAEQPQVRDALEAVAKRILLLNFIQRLSPFSSLPAGKIDSLIQKIRPISVPAGRVIVEQGERGNFCYLLKSGQVDVVLKEGSASRQVSTLCPGALFGEASLLTNSVRNAAVVSRESCELLAIGRQDLFDAVVADRELAARMMELLQLRDRPRRKPGVVEQVVRRDERGDSVVLKDPEAGLYYRLTPEGKFLWDMLDGSHSLRDLTLAYFEHFKAFSPQAIAEVVGGLGRAGFLESATWSTFVRRLLIRLPWFARLRGGLHRMLEYVVVLRHVDDWFGRWHNRGINYLFSIPVQVFGAVVAIAGIAGFAWISRGIIPLLRDYAWWQYAVWLLPALLLTVILHELGHGFTVKHFRREVMGVGVGWYWVSPIAFVDTSDMWLSGRWPRIAVNLAGVMVNLTVTGIIIIAAIATVFITPTAPLAISFSVYAWAFAAISYVITLICLIPLKGTDGYYALMDFLDRK